MDTEALKPILAGVVRHALTGAGGYLVAHGYLQSGDSTAFIGAGMVFAGIAWSWWQKEGQEKFIAVLAKMKPVASPGATTSEAVKAAKVAVAQEQAK
jgi:hypothetical protein